MIYQIKGEKLSKEYNLVYNDGQLSGDEFAVRLVETHAEALEGQMVGPVGGPWTETDHLSDSLSALFVMRAAFDEILEVKGDVPEMPEVPEQAII